jgi:peptidoglycan/LPS O-acetylase OafA/YrhL
MRLLRRRDDDVDIHRDDRDVVTRPSTVDESDAVERRDVVEVDRRRSPIDALTVLAGAALAVLGIVALTRTEIDETWYEPVEQVAGINHTPLLAAIEVGVGALLVLLGLAGARTLTALVCLAVAIAAGVAAVDPGLVDRELAIERPWAITLAASAAVLAVLSMMPRPTYERRDTAVAGRRPLGRYGRVVRQH